MGANSRIYHIPLSQFETKGRKNVVGLKNQNKFKSQHLHCSEWKVQLDMQYVATKPLMIAYQVSEKAEVFTV